MWKQLKRVLFSIFLGSLITSLPLVVLPVLFRAIPDADESPLISAIMRVAAGFLYWPSRFLRFGSLDCPNADEIAEKIDCIGLALAVDVVVYSAVCFMLLWWAARKRAHRMMAAR